MFNSIWFNSLQKPYLTPDSSVFISAWAFLYTTIFTSLIIYSLTKGRNKKFGYIYFVVQLVLNLLWSPAFFLLKSIISAFLIIIILDIFTILTVKEFYKTSRISAYLLFPYLIWIIFATYLNLGYLLLNL